MKKPVRMYVISVLFFCLAVSAFAQNVPPALFVSGAETPRQLAVQELAVEVRITGKIAETQLTMTFFNPSSRRVAGDLYVPLPPNSAVSGFALDINGVLVDGVPVEKQKAREVFEKIVRQGIDPGLAEWTEGSSFKTRVFPIPPRGTRTVRVKYISDCISRDGLPTYFLPMNYKETIPSFSIRIEVVNPDLPPLVRQGGLPDFTFSKWETRYIAETKIKNAAPDNDIYISLPETGNIQSSSEVDGKGMCYFSIEDQVLIPEIPAGQHGPETIALYWDASGSRTAENTGKSLSFLTEYLRRNDSEEVKVILTVFRNTAGAPRTFRISRGNSESLVRYLKSIPYDGGTQLGVLQPAPSDADIAMLFTDGISNFGKEEPPEFGVPLFIYSEGPRVNHQFLQYLALMNNGALFHLDAVPEDEAVRKTGSAPFSFLSAEILSGTVGELYPRVSKPVSGTFRITGQLIGSSASIRIQYGRNGRVETEHTVTVTRDNAQEGTLLRRVWAREKLNDLLIFPDRNQAAITDLGKEFGIVTPGTSLIVLDRLEQYTEHRIPPPESLPEMRARYFDMISREEKAEADRQEQKIRSVLALWQERIEWWQKKFTYPKNFRVKEDRNDAYEEEAPAPSTAPMESAPSEPAPEESLREYSRTAGAEPPEAVRDELTMQKSAKEAKPESEAEPVPEISIKPWDPDTPYLTALKNAAEQDPYAEYIRQRNLYAASPAFFLDCADFFFSRGETDQGLRILSNLAELELENAALLRVLAHRLAQMDMLQLSEYIFRDVLRLRPEEPQSYRDLALVEGRLGKYEQAVRLLNRVILGKWDRFDEIEVIALMELNDLIPKARAAGAVDLPVDPRLIKLLSVDIRIVLTWDADLTDMDLWVIEPSGEKAYYGNQLTQIGGHVSRDFTGGYGPEEYIIRKAMKGTYKIQVNYFSNSAPSLSGAVTLQVEIFTHYGQSDEERKAVTVRLRDNAETIDAGTIHF